MRKYKIVYSEKAAEDLDNLFNAITVDYQSPITAFRYTQGIIDKIESLAIVPTAFAIRHNQLFQQYGFNARRVNYKKMAIIYTIHDNMVFIHRIIAGSLITEH